MHVIGWNLNNRLFSLEWPPDYHVLHLIEISFCTLNSALDFHLSHRFIFIKDDYLRFFVLLGMNILEKLQFFYFAMKFEWIY